MPLFFCISGYLFNNKRKFTSFVLSKIKGILLPYTFFFFTSVAISVVLLHKTYKIKDILKYYLLNGKYCSLICNWAIWYLPAFFCISCIFYFISKLKKRYIFIIAIIAAMFSVPLSSHLLDKFTNEFIPFSVQSYLPGIFFMSLGFLYRSNIENICQKIMSNNRSDFFSILINFISIILFIAGVFISYNCYDQIISTRSYRFFLSAILIIISIIGITYENRNKLLIFFGRNTISILGIHRIILFVFQNIGLGSFLSKYNMNNSLGAILFSFVLVFIICLSKELIKFLYLNKIRRKSFFTGKSQNK